MNTSGSFYIQEADDEDEQLMLSLSILYQIIHPLATLCIVPIFVLGILNYKIVKGRYVPLFLKSHYNGLSRIPVYPDLPPQARPVSLPRHDDHSPGLHPHQSPKVPHRQTIDHEHVLHVQDQPGHLRGHHSQQHHQMSTVRMRVKYMKIFSIILYHSWHS